MNLLVGTSYVRIAITLCYAYVLSILILDISSSTECPRCGQPISMSVAPNTRAVKWSALRVRCPPPSGYRLMVPRRWPYEATPEATLGVFPFRDDKGNREVI